MKLLHVGLLCAGGVGVAVLAFFGLRSAPDVPQTIGSRVRVGDGFSAPVSLGGGFSIPDLHMVATVLAPGFITGASNDARFPNIHGVTFVVKTVDVLAVL